MVINYSSQKDGKNLKGLKTFKGGQPVKVIKTSAPNATSSNQNILPRVQKPAPKRRDPPLPKEKELNLDD